MKLHIQTLLLTVLLIAGCNQPNTKKTSIQVSHQLVSEDSAQIEHLVRQVYKWHETDSSKNDMVMLKDSKDSIYIGVDLEKHKLRLDELRNTTFFSEEFIANYDTMIRIIDKNLKNGKFEWLVGDMPSFGTDVHPWCNCQDYPRDNPWDNIEFKFNNLDNDKSSLSWTWGNAEWSKDFSYNVRVVKVSGTWKISYLQGFDRNEFLGKDY